MVTAPGMAAIASVALWGHQAKEVAGRLFGKSVPDCGHLSYGTLKDAQAVIDSVVLACESRDCYVIHCHGNPLLVEHIVRLCQRYGAVLQSAEAFYFACLQSVCRTEIEAEARLAMTQAATLEAVDLIAGQITEGLTAWATGWINTKTFDVKNLQQDCTAILFRSESTDYLIGGVRIALIGPPNSGKSTLLNWLAAEKAALVSDVAGTTRDWVSTTCRIGPLRAEIIDTAGLDEVLAAENRLEQAAQAMVVEIANTCHLILNVLDCTADSASTAALPGAIPVLTVYTKSDLSADPSAFSLDRHAASVPVSAAANWGLDALKRAILDALHIPSLCPERPVCFTQRQRAHLTKILSCNTENQAKKELTAIIGRCRRHIPGGL